MTQYDNTNRGVLFKNDRKESDNHPDYTGKIDVGGVEYWLSAWIKTGQRGKFMSLSVKPKEARPVSEAVARSMREDDQPQSIRSRAQATIRRPDPISSGPQRNDDMSDDIPF